MALTVTTDPLHLGLLALLGSILVLAIALRFILVRLPRPSDFAETAPMIEHRRVVTPCNPETTHEHVQTATNI